MKSHGKVRPQRQSKELVIRQALEIPLLRPQVERFSCREPLLLADLDPVVLKALRACEVSVRDHRPEIVPGDEVYNVWSIGSNGIVLEGLGSQDWCRYTLRRRGRRVGRFR